MIRSILGTYMTGFFLVVHFKLKFYQQLHEIGRFKDMLNSSVLRTKALSGVFI